jgi:hypothetical protein
MINSLSLKTLFCRLSRSTRWELKRKVDLKFDCHHPQGMVRIGDMFYMSSVEVTELPAAYDKPLEGFDRSTGQGVGHLFMFTERGELLHDLRLGEGSMYHPGGIDWDGSHLWIPAAEYRPNSKAIVYRINVQSMEAAEVFRVQDHIGGLVRDHHTGRLIGYSWGSRRFYEWTPDGVQLSMRENASHFIDYQDGHYIGDGAMILSGIAELPVRDGEKIYELGGLALIDSETGSLLHELPITLRSPQNHVLTRNPVYLESAGKEIRMYAVPDDHIGALLIYETAGLLSGS